MTSLMIRSMLLFLGLMLITKGSYAELSRGCQSFMYVYNGNFSNVKQVKANVSKLDLVEVIAKPVLVPQLQSDPMLYIEEAINGKIYRMFVGKVAADTDDSTFFLEFLNFTDFSSIKPGTYNTENLKNVSRENFKTFEQCPQAYMLTSPGKYQGTWEDCGHKVPREYPRYTVKFNYEGFTFVTSATSLEKETTPVPYVELPQGPRYPLINPPVNLVYPCPDSSE